MAQHLLIFLLVSLLVPPLPVHPLTGESYLRLEYPDREFEIEIWGYDRSSVTYDPVQRRLSEPGWVAGEFHAILKLRDDEFTIDAARIDFDQQQGSVNILPEEGGVVRLGREDRTITAGKVHIDTNTSVFTGEGGISASFLEHEVTSQRLETNVAESHARFIGEVRVHFIVDQDRNETEPVPGVMGDFNPSFEFVDILSDQIEIDFAKKSGEFSIDDGVSILTNEIVLHAGKLNGDYLTQRFVLDGGVEIESRDSVMSCDRAAMDIPGGESIFSGNVVVKDRAGNVKMNCEKVIVGVDEEGKAFFRSEGGKIRFRIDQ